MIIYILGCGTKQRLSSILGAADQSPGISVATRWSSSEAKRWGRPDKVPHKNKKLGRFFNYSIINVHCPHEARPDDEKEAFYAQLEQVYDGCSRRDVKIVISDMNARVGLEAMY